MDQKTSELSKSSSHQKPREEESIRNSDSILESTKPEPDHEEGDRDDKVESLRI